MLNSMAPFFEKHCCNFKLYKKKRVWYARQACEDIEGSCSMKMNGEGMHDITSVHNSIVKMPLSTNSSELNLRGIHNRACSFDNVVKVLKPRIKY